MSAISGIISKITFSEGTLKNMCETLKHRGNSEIKTSLINHSNIYIGFASAIFNIDEEKDRQPCFVNNKILVSDSSIYNLKDIKKELSLSDNLTQSEIIIAAYEKWGYDCVEHFNGDFAITIYDLSKDELYCSRDRFGVKPFYYFMDNNIFLFGSELKSLMAYPGFNKTINSACLGQYIIRGYIHFPDTIFKNTYKLEMGSYLLYKNGNIKKTQYYNIVDEYYSGQKNLVKDYEIAKLQLEELINDAVKIRLGKMTNVGTFLSGGIDSALITALTQKQQINPIKTFTIGFKEKDYNEAPYAKDISKILKTYHTDLYIGEDEMLSIIDNIPYYYDEPYGDSSQIPTMLVSALAKMNGVNLIITGDGGDEQFCGYEAYLVLKKARKLDSIGALLYKITYPLNLTDHFPRKMRMIINNRNTNTKTQYWKKDNFEYLQHHLFLTKQFSATFDLEDRFPIDNWIMRAMLLDLQTYVPGTIIKVERAAAFGSISIRSPLIDHRINQFSFKIPFEYKYNDGVHKRILRDILYNYVPQSLMERPKHGFAIPCNEWLRTVLKEKLLDYTNKDYIIKQGFFNADSLQHDLNKFLDGGLGKFGYQFYWKFLMFQMWYDKYLY
jgi:asparagine synthase (glutamine-hydrolysing)